MILLLVLIVLAVLAGAVAGYLLSWRRWFWRGYDTAWYRREGKQPRRPQSMGDAPGTSGGEQ